MIKNASAPGALVWPLPRASLPSAPVEQRFTAGVAYVDGQFWPIEEARIPLLDWGFLRSDACQETISVWDGSFFRLQDHLERFQRSIGRLRMPRPNRLIESAASFTSSSFGRVSAYWERRASGWYAEPVVYRQASEGVAEQSGVEG
jgi:branched-subunit amino acid aminotransferase/4-amino-4-deoxychorismate lyase